MNLQGGNEVKLKIFIDKNHEEEILLFAHEKNELVKSIEKLVNDDNDTLIGFKDKEAVCLDFNEIYCFVVEENKVYALTEKEKLQLKKRLYQLEEKLPENFVKINQSCIANIKKIKKFDVSFSGSMIVVFKNGYKDCVSRRNVKNIKERLGF